MTHFALLVKFEDDGRLWGETVSAQVRDVLKPYSSSFKVAPYKEYFTEAEVKEAIDHFGIKSLSSSGIVVPYTCRLSTKQRLEWFGENSGYDEKGYYRISTVNPKIKWNDYHIGGAWYGIFKKFKGEPRYASIAYVKDIDFKAMDDAYREESDRNWDKFITNTKVGEIIDYMPYGIGEGDTLATYTKRMNWKGFIEAMVDAKGWLDKHKTTQEKFEKRMFSKITDKTVFAMLDAHI